MKYLAILALLSLSACAHTEPLAIIKNNYVAVSVDPQLLDDKSCPWPDAKKTIVTGSPKEVSNYIVSAYEAWACENDTRKAIKVQVDRQVKDVEARNKTDANTTKIQ